MAQFVDQLMRGGGVSGAGTAVQDASKRIGCEWAVLQAVLVVESGGDAYDNLGRMIILPEKHVFWRELPKKLRGLAVRAGLAVRRWSRANYAGLGRKGSDARWCRLKRMADIHEAAALRSASYGAPQIMGFNHKICGYPTVTEFVLAMAANEENQIAAFVAFLEGVGLAEALRQRDFEFIARRYNGPGQVTRYASMMRREYKKLAGKSPEGVPSKRRQSLRLGSEGDKVRRLQERLTALGYHVSVDGDFGPATQRAVVAFQVDHGLETDGIVGFKTSEALSKAVPIADQVIVADGEVRPANERTDMTVKDLRKRGSKTVKEADRLTGVGGLIAGGGILATLYDLVVGVFGADPLVGISDFVAEIQAAIAPIEALLPGGRWSLLVGVGLAVVVLAHRIKARRLHDAQTWRHVG